MADDMEKTEEPTSKKIEDARKEGNVPRSQDTSSFVTLTVAVVALFALVIFITSRIQYLYEYYISFIGVPLTKNVVFQIGFVSLKELLFMVIPVATIVAISGILAGLMQFGFVFTTKPLVPDLKKIDPIKGLGKLFSMKKLIEGIKITVKVTIVFSIAFYFLLDYIKELPTVINFAMMEQMQWLVEKIIILVLVMLMIFFILGIVDLLIVRFQYFKDLRMSKQEIKDEYKQLEGDPHIKAKIKQVQMQIAQKRMMSDIPSADVIITNPTHYAVALRYDKEREQAPRVIAKGVDHIALKIKEIGRDNSIQVVENPPLARQLYGAVEVDEVIPENLYKAVAEVLAFVFQSQNRSGIN
ncbi:MAG: flagellar biosynthesis protein FlhB [Epsilonproteobacteria bacterium]|nr:flagellar biosynthesis protein FlhB [Campylobacterota bacterium]